MDEFWAMGWEAGYADISGQAQPPEGLTQEQVDSWWMGYREGVLGF